MKTVNTRGKVFVAMSGGVDSSVAALLLVRAGYDVVGVFMKPWQPRGFSCLWEQDRADALRVATALNIPLQTWDFSREYARHVSQPMIRAYRSGLTPNPDVECNRHIKFGKFYERAMHQGADFIATGHYARIVRRNGAHVLATATDTQKDQTYFLWGLRASQLKHILFPVGSLTKPEVRRLASRARVHTATKKDSQGVCFVGPLDMKTFLTACIPARQGDILHVDGHLLGRHDGAGYYTIGQRHGLDITRGGGPYYVVSKDMRRNTITVGPMSALAGRTARVTGVHWIGQRPAPTARLKAKIRYRTASVPVQLTGSRLKFLTPVTALAAGQSVVFYEGSRVAGGAILA